MYVHKNNDATVHGIMFGGDPGCFGGETFFTRVNHKYDAKFPIDESNSPGQDTMKWIQDKCPSYKELHRKSKRNDIAIGIYLMF